MPDSKGRKAMRVITIVVALLGALSTADVVLANTGSSSPAYADLVLDLSVAGLAALIAVGLLAYLLGKHPRALTWLKPTTCALLVLAGGLYAVGAGMDVDRLSGMAGRIGLSALAAWIALWTAVAVPAVVTVLLHDREPLSSSVSPHGVAWRLRRPHWMWAPCLILILLGPASLAAIVVLGTVAAHLIIWSARRCLPDDGTRLSWPGRGGPAVAGIIGILVAVFVFTGVMGQYGQIENRLQEASTGGVWQGLVNTAFEQQGQVGSEEASPLKTVTYLRHGIGFSYQTPTLKAVSISDVPVSLSQVRSAFVDPTSTDMLSSVAIVPTANDPSGLVMVVVTSQPPVWIDQVQGMSKSQFAKVALPRLADSIEQSLAKTIAAASDGMAIGLHAVTHRMINGTPAVVARLGGEVNGTPLAMEMRFLVTRRNLYMVVSTRVGLKREGQDAALRDAFRSVTLRW
jgi:hypothetical protein